MNTAPDMTDWHLLDAKTVRMLQSSWSHGNYEHFKTVRDSAMSAARHRQASLELAAKARRAAHAAYGAALAAGSRP